jgi:esterase
MAFSPSFSAITAPGATPRAYALVLHGILGSGGNWRTFARKLATARPDWGFLLVDLREHGRSKGAPAPHTVAAAAADLEAVVGAAEAPVRAVIAHSFGGKVALVFREAAPEPPAQTWIIDASPSARPEAMRGGMAGGSDVVRVLEMLEELPAHFADRDAFVAEVTSRGFTRMLGQWLAMNLEVADGGAHLALDLGAIRALLSDYFARDAWDEVERQGKGPLHFVLGTRSEALSAEDHQRLDALAAARAGQIFVHRLDAGHWVHVEALDPLVELVAAELPSG